jgi:hypothetical protein
VGRVGQVVGAHQHSVEELAEEPAQDRMVGREDLAHPTGTQGPTPPRDHAAGEHEQAVTRLLVRAPATALMMVGSLAISLSFVVVIWSGLGWTEGPFGKYQKDSALASPLWAMAVASAVYGAVIFGSTSKKKTGRSGCSNSTSRASKRASSSSERECRPWTSAPRGWRSSTACRWQ